MNIYDQEIKNVITNYIQKVQNDFFTNEVNQLVPTLNQKQNQKMGLQFLQHWMHYMNDHFADQYQAYTEYKVNEHLTSKYRRQLISDLVLKDQFKLNQTLSELKITIYDKDYQKAVNEDLSNAFNEIVNIYPYQQ